MGQEKSNKKELLMYLIIVLILVILAVCNNRFWKLGKKQHTDKINNDNNITYFESGNKIYNVPYEEEWLD